jgi:hypothetical protein
MALLRAERMPAPTRELAARIDERRLYKRSLEIEATDPAFAPLEVLWFRPAQRATLEDGWAVRAGLRPGEVLIDVPEPKSIAVDLPVVESEGRAVDWDRLGGLSAPDLTRFQRWVRRIRVFASDHAAAEQVRVLQADLLGREPVEA